MAVIDALLEYNVKDVESYIDIESIKQANALFNNYKDGFISKPDSARIVQKIIMANPYRKDVYAVSYTHLNNRQYRGLRK